MLEAGEVVACCDSGIIRRDRNHSEFTLTRSSREIAEGQTTGPDIRHRFTEQCLGLCPETRWRGDAAEFTEVGGDVVACESAVLASIYAGCGITTPFTTRG